MGIQGNEKSTTAKSALNLPQVKVDASPSDFEQPICQYVLFHLAR